MTRAGEARDAELTAGSSEPGFAGALDVGKLVDRAIIVNGLFERVEVGASAAVLARGCQGAVVDDVAEFSEKVGAGAVAGESGEVVRVDADAVSAWG